MSIEALKAGFHVLTEKPMSVSLKEAAKMLQAAKKTKKLFTIHHANPFTNKYNYPRRLTPTVPTTFIHTRCPNNHPNLSNLYRI